MHARGPGVTVINMEIPVPGLPETIGIAGKLLSKYTVSVGQKWHCTTIGSKVCVGHLFAVLAVNSLFCWGLT